MTLVAVLGSGIGLLAASGTLSDDTAGAVTTRPPVTAGLVGGLVAAVVVGGMLVIWVRAGRGSAGSAGTILAVAVALGALIGMATTQSIQPVPIEDAEPAAVEDGTVLERRPPPLEDRRTPTRFDDQIGGTIVLTVALFMLTAAGVFFARQSELRARERSAVYLRSELFVDEPDSPGSDAVAAALQTSLEGLLASSDPRDAIRAAYGSLLAGLADIGLERRRYEAPGEYIRRCLTSATLPERPITELLGLFEIARFSTRPLLRSDADRAAVALRASIDHLRVGV